MVRSRSFFLLGLFLLVQLPAFSMEPQEQEECVLISELKGIVLLGKWKQDPSILKTEGVDWVDLAIPGRPRDLCKELSAFLCVPVTAKTLSDIKKTISDYYTKQGHPFVLIKVPEQEITSCVLRILILESCLGCLSVEGNRYFSCEGIERYFKIKPGDPIDQSRLIQAVSFTNRNPFRRVDLVFAPGTEKETTNVILATKDRRPVRFYMGSDNLNVSTLGADEWYAGFNWGNAFGLGHILSYQYIASYYNIHRFQAHTAEYTAFFSWGHLLDIYGGYSEVHPPVSFPFQSNDGWSMQASARYLIPLKIYQYLEHEITTGFDFKRTNNTFQFVEFAFPSFGKNVNLTQLVLGYGGNYERNNFRLDFKGTFFWSPGEWISDQTNADYYSLRPGAENKWVYFRGYFIYLQRLPRSCSFSLRLQGQGASLPLLPSEQFGLGGYETVRGYEEREVNADNAVVVNLELRGPAIPIVKRFRPLSTVPDALQFLAFFDSGWGGNIDTIPGTTTTKVNYLFGAGPGVRYTLEPYLTARLDWGIRLHNKELYPGNWSRVHFNVTASY